MFKFSSVPIIIAPAGKDISSGLLASCFGCSAPFGVSLLELVVDCEGAVSSLVVIKMPDFYMIDCSSDDMSVSITLELLRHLAKESKKEFMSVVVLLAAELEDLSDELSSSCATDKDCTSLMRCSTSADWSLDNTRTACKTIASFAKGALREQKWFLRTRESVMRTFVTLSLTNASMSCLKYASKSSLH